MSLLFLVVPNCLFWLFVTILEFAVSETRSLTSYFVTQSNGMVEVIVSTVGSKAVLTTSGLVNAFFMAFSTAIKSQNDEKLL